MDCFIVKLIGNACSEKEVRFYSAFARSHLEYYRKNKMTLWHENMYDILADARDIQEHYAKRDDITDSQIRNTQRDINRFLKGAPHEETYRIKELHPAPRTR